MSPHGPLHLSLPAQREPLTLARPRDVATPSSLEITRAHSRALHAKRRVRLAPHATLHDEASTWMDPYQLICTPLETLNVAGGQKTAAAFR